MNSDPKNVYFMRPVGEDGPIKIGCSRSPIKRLRTMEIWSPALLEIVASAPGEHRDENVLHQMFGVDRRHGEWFEYSERLGGVIAFVQRTGKLPPLDYSLAPYGKPARKSAMTKRNPDWHRAKAVATGQVTAAERYAYGYDRPVRPDEVCATIARYQGFDQPPPTEAELSLLNDYIHGLRQMPKASRSFSAWQAWNAARMAGRAA